MNKIDTLAQKLPGTKPQSKQSLYMSASAHSLRAIERLSELMESRNENVALGASKALLNKALPDLKEMQLEGNTEKPILINLDINPNAGIHGAGKVSTETIAGV